MWNENDDYDDNCNDDYYNDDYQYDNEYRNLGDFLFPKEKVLGKILEKKAKSQSIFKNGNALFRRS